MQLIFSFPVSSPQHLLKHLKWRNLRSFMRFRILSGLPVGGDVDEVLDDATHPEAEGPSDGVVHGRRRDADRHKEEVGEGEILPKKILI